jgi:hypothetical protein
LTAPASIRLVFGIFLASFTAKTIRQPSQERDSDEHETQNRLMILLWTGLKREMEKGRDPV